MNARRWLVAYLAAVVGVDDFRRPVGEPAGHSSGEGVGGFDDMIVDRDHGVKTFGPLRFGSLMFPSPPRLLQRRPARRR